MKASLALSVLAVFAAITDSSVIPSYVNSDSSAVPSTVNSDPSAVPSNVNSDSSDESSPLIVEYTDVLDWSSSDVDILPSLFSGNSSDIPSSRNNNKIEVHVAGTRRPGDLRLNSRNVHRNAISNTVQVQHVELLRVGNRVINYMHAFETISSQFNSVAITGGGIGQSFLRVSITSRRGGGIFYQVEFYGPN